MKPIRNVTQLCESILCFVVIAGGMPHADLGDQSFKLRSENPLANDQFGSSTAVFGTTAIVGAPRDGFDSGAAYLFDTTTGRQIVKLLPNDPSSGAFFGASVSISSSMAIIGAPSDATNGDNSGAAYLFDLSSGTQIAKLLPDDGAAGDAFGFSVAIAGSRVIIGAFGDDDSGTNSGSAYIFSAPSGAQLEKVLPSDGAAQDYFGYSVAIGSSRVIVGAYQDDDNGIESGSAYIFDISQARQIAKLLPSDGALFAFFGRSVGISGPNAIVGAYQAKDDNGLYVGSAYIFATSGGTELRKLEANDAAELDLFGISVAISGTIAIVGAQLDDDNGQDSGSAYLFRTSSGVQLAKLLPSDGAPNGYFGTAVSTNGTISVVGEGSLAFDSDSAYVFGSTPALASESSSISLSTGGSQSLALEGGPARAGWIYFLLGSVTGTAPGIDFGGGVVLPLNFDIYMNLTLTKPGLGAFGNFRGSFDASGQAVSTLTLPAIMDPSLAGVVIHHAYLAGSVFGIAEFASNAVPVTLVL